MAKNRLLEGTITFKESPPAGMAVAGGSSFVAEKNQLHADVEVKTKVGKQTVPAKFRIRPDSAMSNALRVLLDEIRRQADEELHEE